MSKSVDEIHPGEILLEEFMKPTGITALDLKDRIAPRIRRVHPLAT